MRPGTTTITINTDASWDQKTRVGGYAYWIVCDAFKSNGSGVFKSRPANPTDAELMAIGNAIVSLLNMPTDEFPTCKWLVLNTDSTSAKKRIGTRTDATAKRVAELWDSLVEKSCATRHEIRHVKAHSGKDDARSWVNEWCDGQAKAKMREARDKVQKLA